MADSVDIIYANEKYFSSFRDALDEVAREKIYLEMIEAPPMERVSLYQHELVLVDAPSYFAVDGERVVGWCEISREENPRMLHRGSLAIGLISPYRQQGIGARLMERALKHALRFGLEKVELQVNAANLRAIGLYKKFGFVEEGINRRWRKVDGQYFDCLSMAKFL